MALQTRTRQKFESIYSLFKDSDRSTEKQKGFHGFLFHNSAPEQTYESTQFADVTIEF